MGENRERPVPRVADTIAATLHEHGARHAFGMPGGEVVTLVDALEKAGIRFHLARHETAAASMAAGASHRGGAPGILVTTVGPGLANAVNGIADALQERVPLVVLSGIVDRSTRARYTHQVIDHAALLRPIVKASFEVEPESAASTIARALAIACAEPMGPVHLDISPAVAAMVDPAPRAIRPTTIRRPSIGADDGAVASLAGCLDAAARPIILAGFEAARASAGEAVRRLAEKIEAPVITTYKAKGLIDETHPLSLGAAGLSPAADRVLLSLFSQADLVLMVGYDPIEMRLGWLDAADPDHIVELTAAPPDHAMHHCGSRFVADTTAAVDVLATAVVGHPSWLQKEPARAAKELKRVFRRPDAWGPHAIIETLNEMAGRDALVTVDSGAHRILLSQKWVSRRPLSLLQSAGFCTMAAALPLAIGAKVADPSRRVIAVMGDGGLEMGLGELATVRDLALPLTIVVFQDSSLALIALKQRVSGLAPAGVALGQTDFAMVAEGFGGYGVNVHDAPSLQRELSAAESRSSFTLISCRFDADAYQDAF
ncbi:acetolactate synthase-1/2/3 large subunit [Sinorhizobium medicae]|uniref:thiamine pyrophosphate-binding protein n=1 Tax=Sinorhizobium medicae TaxID=110321 RepID=UPI00119D63ED|nr:thiamine pyrophosphate-binding protein [Sinorhizobium medicae]MDX0692864.1 thiamine pyrophosphate-binding protein [Sinorhizobium medicae]MDX0744375.1 thiamine pyrophosphate-binding protein [Sinorhizobium medicae]MDX1199996.1 thiamine pyrophosphate-binding protein [Sinorhizobium medicae]TWA56628.1 acetolactate synthase-1/2/3 large subunit [Sinorhizobium medicae]WQO56123.1 thiamine pyrophosphate-binding protein [Sinorhizobium medicae]